jgi:hypothetical protein
MAAPDAIREVVCISCPYRSTDPAVIEEARQFYVSEGEHELLYGTFVIYDLCPDCIERWEEDLEYLRQNPDARPPKPDGRPRSDGRRG